MVLNADCAEFDIFVGSRIGSLKHIKYHLDPALNSKKCIENLQEISTLQKDDTVTSMAWATDDEEEILLGRANGVVQTYNTVVGDYTSQIVADHGKGHVVGACRVNRRLVTALSDGAVRVWGKKRQTDFSAGGQIDNMKCCRDEPGLIVTGGKENDLKVWRLGEQEPVFAAKNVRHDQLELRQPVWATDVCFLPGGSSLVASCSRYGTVRLYDTRVQRRPVCDVPLDNMAATCIAPGLGERQVLVGFARGQLHSVDLRARGRPDRGYRGAVGAVTDAALVPGGRYVVSVGLDRHVKVHDAATKKLLYKQYLTSKLSRVLMQTARSTPLTRVKSEAREEGAEPEGGAADGLDEIFQDMQTVSEKPKKKRSGKRARPEPTVDSDVQEVKSEEEKESGNEDNEDETQVEDGIAKLLKLTEKKKRKMEKMKKKKKAKSVFHNA